MGRAIAWGFTQVGFDLVFILVADLEFTARREASGPLFIHPEIYVGLSTLWTG